MHTLNEVIELNKKFTKEKINIFLNSLYILEYVYKKFKNIKFASSFGWEDVVVIDLLCKIRIKPTVFFLDTGRHFAETYDVVNQIQKKYNINLEIYFPEKEEVENLVNQKGFFSFYESIDNRKECCYIRKVKPLKRALQNCDCWITGLRKGQGVTRISTAPFELDIENNNILKVNPLYNWSLESVRNYIEIYKIPYNILHNQNYLSIGCQPCTRPVQPGEDIRSGRWWWEQPEHKECGLHKKQEDNQGKKIMFILK